MPKSFGAIIILFLSISCDRLGGQYVSIEKIPVDHFSNPPEWASAIIWYEISVERFRNGDKSNDPTVEDIKGSYPGIVPHGWTTTPWTHDWYKDDPYFSNLQGLKDSNGYPIRTFAQKAQLRRYGGDLKGVLDKLDYLDSLGITAIYFRPLNDAPSLHKYDARNWRHVDVNFGPDPEGDKQIIRNEIPDRPETWKFTAADKMFLDVINNLHKRGIKVIMDYSWNHTGTQFWAWQDVLSNQSKSDYKDWYWIEDFDDPNTPQNEFKYQGWSGVSTLPEIRETHIQDLSNKVSAFEGDIYSKHAKKHIFNVVKRWLDPNNDGDTSDGVDGFRLDVAAETPLGFWREFRTQVKTINSEAYLVGEIWWEQFPDKLLDPEPYLMGDIFDAVMNYRWYRSVRHFFNESPNSIGVSELVDSLNRFRSNIRDVNDYSMMNYTGGFDTPRILTSLFNKNKYKYQAKVHENAEYKIYKPDSVTYNTLKLLLIQQFTYVGSPHIYAGDEMGMWGADDPSSRKPLIWKDYHFESERAHPTGLLRPIDEVRFNENVFNFYQNLIAIRKQNSVLSHGILDFIIMDNERDVLVYSRYNDSTEILVAFNVSDQSQQVKIPKRFRDIYLPLLNEEISVSDGHDTVEVQISPRSAIILKSQP